MSSATELDRPVVGGSTVERGRPRSLTGLSVLAVLLPFLVVGIRLNLTGAVTPGGEAALADLHARDAAGVDQLVGPWVSAEASQPGPVWFYLLAAFRSVYGDSGAGLVAASLTLHALAAALLVLAVGRARPWDRPLLALVVLLVVVRLPPVTFVQVEGPAALLLPTALALVLAARAAIGSAPALAGLAVVGTVLVQTDVRTAPLVALLAAVAAVGSSRAWRRGSGDPRSTAGGRGLLAVLIGALATVALWVPPLWQQLRPGARGGNLGRLAHEVFGSSPESVVSWRGAVQAVGQLLGAPLRGESGGSVPLDVAGASPAAALTVVAQVAAAVVVAGVARRRGRPFVAALGLVLAVATVAAVSAARSVVGQLSSGSVLWVMVLPMLLLACVAWLLAGELVGRRPGTRRWGRPVVGVALTATAVVATVGLFGGAEDLTDRPGVEAAAELVRQAVPAEQDDQALVLDVRDQRSWPTLAGLANELDRADRRVTVEEPWVEAFGARRTATGEGTWRVTLVTVADIPAVPYGSVIGTVQTDLGETAVVLGPPAPPG
ncbi:MULTISPECIES: hypothetical protein [unclassified Modestobacter]|uniref:hypothetical protein n=1 Tax=unclassified Modestobacter TaxID=2643866 RepID=UPI0022AA6BC2|nr:MULTISPECIES: hypothetical protein [unclassified Modestobacter]MCZ2823793.1 hypothetical protein [Modestobacter sp. VKM Ac-2981]MCZ2852038.1 hypothetical protein [Modestobacter sp. VKM Ac-2982]